MGLAAVTAIPRTHRAELAARQRIEWIKCHDDVAYFIDSYVQIYDAIAKEWVLFHLWPGQYAPLRVMQRRRLSIHLKARQIGMTWLALAYALHKMLFYPISTVLLFSKRDDEATELLDRLKDMHRRLPVFLRARSLHIDNEHEWKLSVGSRALAFPTTAGDSYTASLVICDEFDLVLDQDRVMSSVKPTIANGGQMILLSRPDKNRPNTRFKQIYRSAQLGQNDWTAVFLPWWVHPGRTPAWYEAERADILSSTGSDDELHEQYPATDTEALAPRTLNKRFAPSWLAQCYRPEPPRYLVGVSADVPSGVPAIPGLKIFRLPEPDRTYMWGADPAEGLASSDDSSLTVGDALTGEEVARLDGKFEPKFVFPGHIKAVSDFYHGAAGLVERNNHGHAVLAGLLASGVPLLGDLVDQRAGWNNSPAGKVRLYDTAAASLMTGDALIHDFGMYTQLESIELSTLSAPKGERDDQATSCALMLQARALPHPELTIYEPLDW